MTDPNAHELHLATIVLLEKGFSPDDASRALRLDPGLTAVLRSDIDLKRKELRQQAAAQIQAAYEASPEGRAEAALKAREETQKRAELAEGARALLGDQAEGMSDDEVLDAAGIEEGPITQARRFREEDERLANDLDANLAAANDDLIEETSE